MQILHGTSDLSASAGSTDACSAALRSWVSVEERLPEKFTEVLIAFKDCTLPATGQYTGNLRDSPEGWCYPAENHGDGFDWTVTHWMPLPLTPKEIADATGSQS